MIAEAYLMLLIPNILSRVSFIYPVPDFKLNGNGISYLFSIIYLFVYSPMSPMMG